MRFLRHEIIAPRLIDGLPDEICNLARAASPPRCQADPIHSFRTCVDGSLVLLTLAARTEARIPRASTSELHGDPEIAPQLEGHRGNLGSVGPRACDDEGKRAAGTLLRENGAHAGLRTRIARIFNTCSPRMDPEDGRVVSNLVIRALRGQPPTAYGEGLQTRSFRFVDDLIGGLVRLMASDEAMPVNPGNPGNPGEFTAIEPARKALRRLGRGPGVIHLPLPADDPRRHRPDITRARLLRGWSPTVALHEGLDRTIARLARRIGAEQRGGLVAP